MTRALLRPLAQRDTLKPGGTLILSTGISPGALGAGGWAIGASIESAMLAGWPCFQGGGGVACWAGASWASESPTASATVSDVRMMQRIVGLPFEDERIGQGRIGARSVRHRLGPRPGPYVRRSLLVNWPCDRWACQTEG